MLLASNQHKSLKSKVDQTKQYFSDEQIKDYNTIKITEIKYWAFKFYLELILVSIVTEYNQFTINYAFRRQNIPEILILTVQTKILYFPLNKLKFSNSYVIKYANINLPLTIKWK